MSMARNVLPLSYYEAQMVRMPLHEGEAKVVEALRVVVLVRIFRNVPSTPSC